MCAAEGGALGTLLARVVRHRLDGRARYGTSALVAGVVNDEDMTTLVQPRRRLRRPSPFRAPLPECAQHRKEVNALVSEVVFVARRVVGVQTPLDDRELLELPQALGEDVAGRTREGSDLVEAVDAVPELPDGDERPALTNDLQRRRDGTRSTLWMPHRPDRSTGLRSRHRPRAGGPGLRPRRR